MTRRVTVLMVLLLVPFFVFAHGNNYLEFNPDYYRTDSLKVSTTSTMYEIFLPANEFLSGVDFWFDNDGSSDQASFELYDQNNNLLRTRSITIPHIDPISGGQRVHIDWHSQIAVVASSKYKIKISSNLPQLRIYYSDRVKFLGHNEPYSDEYLNGAAEIGGEEREFSFKYALYETTESSVPIISNVFWTVMSENQMRMDFNTNEPIDFQIEYGLLGEGYTQVIGFTGEYSFCTSGITSCNIFLNVIADSEYQYKLTVKDVWGNQAEQSGSFTSGESIVSTLTPTPSLSGTPTESPSSSPSPQVDADNEPPVISNLKVANLTDTSVEIAWSTDEIANSHLLISAPFLISIIDDTDPTFELEHLLGVEGLVPNANYLATVTSIDPGSNKTKDTISFSTIASTPAPVESPSTTPTSIPAQAITTLPNENNITTSSGSSGGSGVVNWQVPSEGEPGGGYRVDIFDKDGKLRKTVVVPSGTYSVEIPGLENGEYSVIVYANDNEVFRKIDKPAELRIEDPPFTKSLLAYWWALIPLGAGLGYMFWRNHRQKLQAI